MTIDVSSCEDDHRMGEYATHLIAHFLGGRALLFLLA